MNGSGEVDLPRAVECSGYRADLQHSGGCRPAGRLWWTISIALLRQHAQGTRVSLLDQRLRRSTLGHGAVPHRPGCASLAVPARVDARRLTFGSVSSKFSLPVGGWWWYVVVKPSSSQSLNSLDTPVRSSQRHCSGAAQRTRCPQCRPTARLPPNTSGPVDVESVARPSFHDPISASTIVRRFGSPFERMPKRYLRKSCWRL